MDGARDTEPPRLDSDLRKQGDEQWQPHTHYALQGVGSQATDVGLEQPCNGLISGIPRTTLPIIQRHDNGRAADTAMRRANGIRKRSEHAEAAGPQQMMTTMKLWMTKMS